MTRPVKNPAAMSRAGSRGSRRPTRLAPQGDRTEHRGDGDQKRKQGNEDPRPLQKEAKPNAGDHGQENGQQIEDTQDRETPGEQHQEEQSKTVTILTLGSRDCKTPCKPAVSSAKIASLKKDKAPRYGALREISLTRHRPSVTCLLD